MELEQKVMSLFRAFNRRALAEVEDLCGGDVTFEAATAEFAERPGAYSGREGMREYFADVDRIWEELLITPRRILAEGGEAVALGRVFARSRRLGLRDLPIGWRLRDGPGGFEWIKVYDDRAEALRDWERATRGD